MYRLSSKLYQYDLTLWVPNPSKSLVESNLIMIEGRTYRKVTRHAEGKTVILKQKCQNNGINKGKGD